MNCVNFIYNFPNDAPPTFTGGNKNVRFLENNTFRLAMSAAASWAWGTSLIMGQQIAQEKGIITWIIWALCNTVTLAVFGSLYKRLNIKESIQDSVLIKIIAILIQMFCLVVQLNFIYEQIVRLFGGTSSYLYSVVIGIIFIMIVAKNGLKTSINVDTAQWIIAMIAIMTIIIYGLITGAPKVDMNEATGDDIVWGLWSGLVLLAGPIGDIQHWQRADKDKNGNAYHIAAMAFGIYMITILVMSIFKFNGVMNILLLIAVFNVTTSTIDSIAVSLHELGGKKIGTACALIICGAWGLIANMGIIELWSSFGIVRVMFAISIIALSIKSRMSFIVVSIVSIIVLMLVLTGNAVTLSVTGVISIAISIIILVYCIKSIIWRIKNEG